MRIRHHTRCLETRPSTSDTRVRHFLRCAVRFSAGIARRGVTGVTAPVLPDRANFELKVVEWCDLRCHIVLPVRSPNALIGVTVRRNPFCKIYSPLRNTSDSLERSSVRACLTEHLRVAAGGGLHVHCGYRDRWRSYS